MAVTWITAGEVATELGNAGRATEPKVVRATAVANDWCRRRRSTFGYVDVDETAPNASVKEGAILFAVSLVNARGQTDSVPSYQELGGTATSFGSMGEVNRLLGIPRPGFG